MTRLQIKKLILLFILISPASIAAMSDHFVTTWNTEYSRNDSNSSIEIPINEDYQYSYDVDWNNDGIFDDIGVTTSITHEYGSPGIRTVRIRGDFPAISLGYYTGVKLISIDQWGTNPWQTMNDAFKSTDNLVNKASDTPNL